MSDASPRQSPSHGASGPRPMTAGIRALIAFLLLKLAWDLESRALVAR